MPPVVLSHLPEAELPGLRQVILGGEAWGEELVEKWGDGRMFFNSYGPTETDGASHDNGIPAGRWKTQHRKTHQKCAYLSAECVRFFGSLTGVTGELYIGGDGVARGYIDSALTAERFMPDPFRGEPGGRLLPHRRLGLLAA